LTAQGRSPCKILSFVGCSSPDHRVSLKFNACNKTVLLISCFTGVFVKLEVRLTLGFLLDIDGSKQR